MEPYKNTASEKLLFFGSSQGDFNDNEGKRCTCFNVMFKKVAVSWTNLQDFSCKAWEMGRNDPRKVVFGLKMGLALSLVSLLLYWDNANSIIDVEQYSVWAILTVVVMFEFSIGATFIKGFNRALGTITAGILAFGFAELSELASQYDKIIIITSIFIIGFIGSYLKLYPTMVPYEYGYRVFVLTYCILMVAGNRTSDYTWAVITRLLLIAFGAFVTVIVNICIYPIWSGEDLHSLVVKNFKGVATSLEGCVDGYLNCVEYDRIPSKIIAYQASDDPLYSGYRSVIESINRESTLLGFAIWEPPHGRYGKFNYPWEKYVKVSGALRHCAFTVMALHGCILSEIQAPAERRLVFRNELKRVSAEGAKVLLELGNKVEKMEKLSPGDILKEVHEAAEQLQKKIDQRSYLMVNSESWEIRRPPEEVDDFENFLKNNIELVNKSRSEAVLDIRSLPIWTPSALALPASESLDTMFKKEASNWPSRLSFSASTNSVTRDIELKTYESASALSLATFTSLLIEFVARLQHVVDLFEELSGKADFKEPIISPTVTTKPVWFWTRLFFWLKLKRHEHVTTIS